MKQKRFPLRTKEIYSNCALYDHKGLLCRCSYQRAQWYVKRGLATVISEDPYEVLLNFDPGVTLKDREVVYSIHKKNICCVCGSDDITTLTRHHIVPLCFRKNFPENYKSCLSHDVLPACNDCHTAYHRHTSVKIRDMFEQCSEIRNSRTKRETLRRILGMCKAVKLDTVPQERKDELVKKLYSKWDAKYTIDEIAKICLKEKNSIKNDADIYIEQLQMSLEEFILFWRLDFVKIMSPNYLPGGWSLDHKTHN